MKIARHMIVKGRVQGVGFRYFARQEAKAFGLNGYVKNLYNGDVEIYIEGEDELVNLYQKKIKQGPPYGHVEELNVDERAFENRYDHFEVAY